ncbi:DEAD/DEAH box helicase [Streptomyces sp. NPDC050617]|uniref:DEAD/DEAH box helicase n=1 Tax=Streptomyces sp. NPDC050617 TaxID=3154628 RepID=UPI0034213FB0
MAGPVPGAVRPPSPPRSASHRRGKILSTFRDLGILSETAEALEAVGIVSPFPIQEMTLPVALSGSDVIGQAKTGTGKTLGFGLPLLERVTVPADVEADRATSGQLTDAPQALVVVPTRELCQQVTNDLLTAGKVRNVRVLAIYGGRAYEPQVEALKKGVDVIVGTPGRLLDLAGQKKLDLSHVKALVLDEADEMLDLGFLPDVERIITMLPVKRQTMLFSATMPGAVIGLARRYMSQPTHIRATSPDDEGQTVRNTTQHVFRAHSMDKPEMVARILQADGRGLAMVFCRTKRTAADIADQLARRGFASGAVHGDLGQGAREQALRAFRNGKVDVLVCTDVAARGIDVDNVTHVINYQSPEDEKTYLHRIGRTGRAGKSGTAVTLVDWDDIPRWKLINKALDLPFDEPEETYSTSEHLFELLSIPQGTKGILPRAERTRAGLAAEEIEDLGETGGRGRGRKPVAAAPVATEERPARNRTPRQRRRTRGGSTVGSEAAASPVTPVAAETAVEAPGEAVAEGAPKTPRTPRRRRRTRTGAAPAAPAAAATVTSEAPAPAAQAAQAVDTVAAKPAAEKPAAARSAAVRPEAAAGSAAVEEAAVRPRRRRPRVAKPAVDEPSFVTVESTIASMAAEAEANAAKANRTRTAKSEAAEAVATAEGTDAAKPKRTRTTKAKTAETAVDTVEATAEAPAKPKRTRTAKPKADAAVDTAEAAAEAPAKPKRTRTAKAKTAEAAVDTVEATAEAPAKPKRTRTTKPKAAAEAVVDTVEATAEAPAKRTRTAKAKTAETAVDTAEATAEAPAKPKRTRTAKPKAEAAETAVEGAEAKPRRRATRAAQPVSEAGADAVAEAPAKPKRTRAAKPKATTEG